MIDIIENLYDIRDTAWDRVQILKRRIAKDTAELAKQEKLSNDAELSAELLCASDLFGRCCSTVPKESGLVRVDKS